MKISDELYNLAYEFKSAALWDFVWDNEIFAVKVSSGEMVYCSVLGRNGECFALNMYVGEKGWNSYLRLQYEPASFAEQQEMMLSQECLQISFDEKINVHPTQFAQLSKYATAKKVSLKGMSCANFVKYRKRVQPWPVQEESDFKIMEECMRAALYITKRFESGKLAIDKFFKNFKVPLYTPKGTTYTKRMVQAECKYHEKVVIPGIQEFPRIAKAKKKGTLFCDLVFLPMPIADGGTDKAPRYPLMLMVATEDGFMILNPPTLTYEENPEEIVTAFADSIWQKNSVPKKIVVRNERTYKLLFPFCEVHGITLSVDKVEHIDDAYMDMLQMMMGDRGGRMS